MITALDPATTTGATTDKQTAKTVAPTVNKEDFLKLLVAQIKNQDPTNPLKNEEFVAQLATFSSLEQLISINDAVTKIAAGQDRKDTNTPFGDTAPAPASSNN